MKSLVLGLCVLAVSPGASWATVYATVRDGNWDDPSIWASDPPSPGTCPQAFDVAQVNHSITVGVEAACGELIVATGRVDIVGSSVHLSSTTLGSFRSAFFLGDGTWRNQGETTFRGPPSSIFCPVDNQGTIVFVDTPGLQLEAALANSPGATVRVDVASFAISGTTGVGVVQNAGTFQLGTGVVCSVDRLDTQGGTMTLKELSRFIQGRSGSRHANGNWVLDAGAVYAPVPTNGDAYYDGDHVSTGPGEWRMDGGTLMVSHVSTTDTTFNVGGGGFCLRSGTIHGVPLPVVVKNYGRLRLGCASNGNQILEADLVNHGTLEIGVTGMAANIQGAGTIRNRGTARWYEGSIGAPIVNNRIWFFHGRTGQIQNAFANEAGATVVVDNASCSISCAPGTGVVQNAGMFQLETGVVCSVDRFDTQNGTMTLKELSRFIQGRSGSRHANGNWVLEAGAVYEPVPTEGYAYYDGNHVATGPGCWRMDGGTLMVSHVSTTDTTLNVGGGGFLWRGGTIDVQPPKRMINAGTLHAGGGAVTQWVQGALRNKGTVRLGETTTSVVRINGDSTLDNEGTWEFAGSGGTLAASSPTTHFYNWGQMDVQADGATVDMPAFNMGGSTLTVRRGTANFNQYLTVYGGRVALTGGNLRCAAGLSMPRSSVGVLGGLGVVTGFVFQSGGTLAPGLSPGRLGIDGDYALGTNGTLQIELGGRNAGTGYDQLDVASNASVKGTLNVELYDGYAPAGGQRFDILLSGTLDPTNFFRATNLPALPPDTDWLLLYRTNGVQLRVATTADADGDGLGDDWETAQFGDLATSDGGEDDYDDDGYTDYLEQVLDTQPTNKLDHLRIADFALSGSNGVVALHTGSNAQYAIEAATDLSGLAGSWDVVDEFQGPGGEVVRSNAASGPLRFYRLKATAPR